MEDGARGGASDGAAEGAREEATDGAWEGATDGAWEGAWDVAREGACDVAREGARDVARDGAFERGGVDLGRAVAFDAGRDESIALEGPACCVRGDAVSSTFSLTSSSAFSLVSSLAFSSMYSSNGDEPEGLEDDVSDVSAANRARKFASRVLFFLL